MKISENEVYNIAFNQNITLGLLKYSQFRVAKTDWIDAFLPEDFLDDLETNTAGNYDEFIESYIKPVWAWGVLYNNFNYLMVNLTDGGDFQLLLEGTAALTDRFTKQQMKYEIKNTIFGLLKELQKFCLAEKANENALYDNFIELELKTSNILFIGKPSRGQIYY